MSEKSDFWPDTYKTCIMYHVSWTECRAKVSFARTYMLYGWKLASGQHQYYCSIEHLQQREGCSNGGTSNKVKYGTLAAEMKLI